MLGKYMVGKHKKGKYLFHTCKGGSIEEGLKTCFGNQLIFLLVIPM
jgi:hypothetical protein